MKKLITIMASMATCLLFGDFVNSGTSFEEYGDRAFNPAKDDQGTDGGYRYWSSATSDNAIYVLTNYVDEVGSDATKTPTNVVSRPDMFASDSNTKYLAIDTDTRLYRTAESIQSNDFTQVTIPDNGIYLDTLVKFTPAEDETGLVLEGTDKIAIAYVENPETFETNFVVRAGYLSSPIAQTNYVVAVPSGFKSADWHRLTVRSFASIDDNMPKHVGFVVYLDEVPLEYDTDVDAGPGFAATGAAAAFYTSELHALYPSAVPADQLGGSAIAAVAFIGNGAVDDVTFTTDTPNFIKAGEQVRTEITLGTGVAAVTVTVGVNTINPEDAAANPLVFNLPAGTTNFVLGVTAADTYEFDEATGIELANATYDAATDTVLFDAGTSPSLTVKATRNSITYINDNDVEVPCVTLSDAFANVKDGGTIKLAYDFTVATDETTVGEQAKYDLDPDKEIFLDLNGNTLNGGSGEVELFYLASGKMTVIDSVGGGKIIYDGAAVFGTEALLYVGATTGDNGVTIDGVLFTENAEGQIVRGNFYKDDNSTDDDPPTFIYAGTLTIETGSELKESLGDYWVVAPEGGSEPEVIAVPTAASNLVYDGTEQTGVAAGTGYTLSGDFKATNAGEYTAIATPASGYAWVGGSTDATNITWSIAADSNATVVVTLESEIAEYSAQLEFPTATATINEAAVAGTPVWDPATITEPAAGATNTYTVTFTVTTANYAGSTGSATFKVYKAAQSGGGHDSGDGSHSFVIPTAKEEQLKEALPAGKTLDSTVPGTTDLTFAQAYALGLWDEDATEVAPLEAEISVGADGKVTVALANQPADGFLVTCKVYEKASLTAAEWTLKKTYAYGSEESAFTPGSTTAGFYKVEVVISNSLQ